METTGSSPRRHLAAKVWAGVLIVGLGVGVAAVLTWQLTAREDDSPAFTFAYPVADDGFESEPRFLPLGDLLEQADVVVVATVDGRASFERQPAGNADLTAVDGLYALKVEEYLKGGGDFDLQLRKTVAYESPQFEATYVLDNLEPFADRIRYVFALRKTDDGSFAPVAEPFRFRLDSGRARAESTIDEFGEVDLTELGYSEMSEVELRSAIAAASRPRS